MNETLDCVRAEDLLSDRLAGALEGGMAAALDAHLGACERCRALAEAVGEVVDALQSFPAMEPAADLAERAAAAALASRGATLGRRRWATLGLPDIGLPVGLQVMAAAIALVVTGGAVVAATQSSKLRERTVNAGAYLSERKDRVFEDLRLLKVVVTTAFEGRLDRMNDRVDDYRRLLEKRRAVEQQQKQTSEPKSDAGSVRAARHAQFPPRWWNSNNAGTIVVTASERALDRIGRSARRES
jgi:Putative zinc-finger